MKNLFALRALVCLAFLLLLWPFAGAAAPFTPGNIVVVRIGDGVAAIPAAAAGATFLLEYTPSGTLVQTIVLPTATAGTNHALTNTASSSSDGSLTRSVDGHYLVLTGYDAAPGTAALLATTSAANNRVIGRVAANGTVNTSTLVSDAFSAGNIRGAASVDGSTFYAVGSNSGVHYLPFGNTGTTTAFNTAAPTNLRTVNIFGGNLYIASATGAFNGISQVGTGLPTTAPQTITLLPGFSAASGPSPYAFYFADLSATVPGVDVVYVADDRLPAVSPSGGVQKWSLVGGTWTLNGVLSSPTAIRSLTGSATGSTVSLVAGTDSKLFALTDNAGYNAAPSFTVFPTEFATAAANTKFRGVALAPTASTTAAPTVTSFTPTSGASGATVTITGTNFTGATAVTLNGSPISGYTVVNATTITFTVPGGASTGAIAVTTAGGTATSATSFTVNTVAGVPTIASFTPTTGPTGTTVTLTGTNFTGTTAVMLNGAAITGYTVVNATTINFTVPATGTSGPIAVTNASGTATSSTSFTVAAAAPAPTVTSFTPARAVAGTGPVIVTINGTNLVAGATASFNGTGAYTLTPVGTAGTSATVSLPASALTTVGSYPVTVTNSGGTSTALNFSVVAPATTTAYEDFEMGTKTSYAAGNVTLRSGIWTFDNALIGNQFNDKVNQVAGARIRGGGFIAMNFDKPNGAGIISVSAALYGTDAAASFTLEISSNGGTTYTPVTGAPAALTTTLTPYTFTVNRTGNIRLRFTSTNTTVGANPRIDLDDLNITDYTVAVVPTITSFTPTSGASGATVTVTGTNFTGATAVTLNGVAISGYTVVNATTITFTVPATGTSGPIAVTTASGTATSTASFTVMPVAGPVPTITGISPARAVVGGPAFTLTVNGTNLTLTTTISFNGQTLPAATLIGTAGTAITVQVPASAIAAVATFPVVAANGTSVSTGPTTFSVVAAATSVVFEDFEQGTAPSYTNATPVALRSGAWTFTNALVGDLFNDRVNQAKAARIRGGGSIAMNFDKPNGAGTVTISAATYGSDTGASFTADISTDGGLTYSPLAGAPATLTNALVPYTFTANRPGNVRLRFTSTNTVAGQNPRINLDDLNITNYVLATNPGQALPGLALYPNPTQGRLMVGLPQPGAAQVLVRDLLGRVVMPLAPLPATGEVVLPAGLAAGSYLLEVRQGTATAVRRITKE